LKCCAFAVEVISMAKAITNNVLIVFINFVIVINKKEINTSAFSGIKAKSLTAARRKKRALIKCGNCG
jgi:hypothetical protein